MSSPSRACSPGSSGRPGRPDGRRAHDDGRPGRAAHRVPVRRRRRRRRAGGGRPRPRGPPFVSADGVLFELETLDPGAWAEFWRALEAPSEAIRAGWRPFQFRYATACAPFPVDLHEVTRRHTWARIRQAAALSGAEVCRLRTLAERAGEDDGADPWTLRTLGPGRPAAARRPRPPRRTGRWPD
ncbi:hypothetical protein O1L60_36835 [Streptomyces diastatochromogenes]|nr:hypothetical protein [Streptomyces diastatochromogenes]